MTVLHRVFSRLVEFLAWLPVLVWRVLIEHLVFNPRLGRLRPVLAGAALYLIFAVVLVYGVAPIRAITGHYTLGDKLRYDAERWLATAIYDSKGGFIGTFDPRLDSQRDVNYTEQAIEYGDYTANPDHKSIPVRDVPEHYWQCLKYHEDRYLGGPLNPFGIDLLGVLKIPYSIVQRTLLRGRPSLGAGGSTLPMQFVRVIYDTPPDAREGALTKLRRKLSEWWLAPVVYRELTRGGDITPLKQWAANHIWLAQRTGGAPLHGVEITSRIVFGKEAADLSTAEQFVLASAVNKPIILLPGSDKLNEVRLDRWRYITEVRAKICAEQLITDEAEKTAVVFELVGLAGGPPDPKVKPRLQKALDTYAPEIAARAEANPVARANTLMPSARFGLREEMKQTFGFGWRAYVRGVTTTFDAVENLGFARNVGQTLVEIDGKSRDKISAGFTLDPAKLSADTKLPNVVVVAANAAGEIVRYYETGETAAYYGAPIARDSATGFYQPSRDPRMIASTGKIISAIAIANSGRDTAESLYVDSDAPSSGLETCSRGANRHGRKAIVAFACSLNSPLLNRTALAGQSRVQEIIDKLGFTSPPADANGEAVPSSTAATLGLISGSPRRVHHMAAVVLASLLKRSDTLVKPPTLIRTFDYTSQETKAAASGPLATAILPSSVIRPGSAGLLKTLLEAPLCYAPNKTPTGTLKSLSHWCAGRRGDIRLHFAKTGTQVTSDPNATVDVWTAGGLQFANGAAYSYVVLVGTGSTSEPWGTSLHAAQVAAPLVETLLKDLAVHAKANPMGHLLPPRPQPKPVPMASAAPSRETGASGSAVRPATAADETLKSLMR